MHIINWAIGNQAAKGLKNVQFSTEKNRSDFSESWISKVSHLNFFN